MLRRPRTTQPLELLVEKTIVSESPNTSKSMQKSRKRLPRNSNELSINSRGYYYKKIHGKHRYFGRDRATACKACHEYTAALGGAVVVHRRTDAAVGEIFRSTATAAIVRKGHDVRVV